MRVLIINLTRFGDLLQTQPVVHALRDQGHRVGLVCLENFAEAGALLDGVEALIPLPGSGLLAALDNDWRQSTGLLYRWLAVVRRRFSPQQVLNLTSSSGARLLARLLLATGKTSEASGGTELRGFSVDAHGFGNNGTLWGAFFEASTRKRGCSPYNLADVFRKAAGLGALPARFTLRRPAAAEAAKMAARLAEGGKVRGYVAFQPGASEERRRWPVAAFAELGRRIHEQCGFMPVLLGAANERDLAEAYLGSGAPAVDLLGKTSLAELAATLTLTRLLVTNDTGTMHLAAGLGVPSLAFFLATAQACDTGPYLEDCCCLEPALACHPCGFGAACPDGLACRERLSPEAVWPLVEERLTRGSWPRRVPAATAAEARVWLSCRDEAGFLDLHSLSGHENEERAIWLRLQRHFYRQFLDSAERGQDCQNCQGCQGSQEGQEGQEGQDCQEGQEPFLPLSAEDAAAVRCLPPERRRELRGCLAQAEELLHLLLRQGELFAAHPSPQAGQRFLSTAHRITAYLESCDAGGAFDALARLWTAAAQEHGGELATVTELAARFQSALRAWGESLETSETG